MEKLGNRQTKDHIADMLREEILSGRIADGEELTQEQLAEQLEVSRMPVREALQTLELEGLLVRLPNRHMRVVGLREHTAYENMRIVAAVEAEIAALLVERAYPLPKVMDFHDDQKFHSWFSEQLSNPYLRQAHRRLLNGYPGYIWRHCGSGAFEDQNSGIWAAVKDGDYQALHQRIRGYYRGLARRMFDDGRENGDEQSQTN